MYGSIGQTPSEEVSLLADGPLFDREDSEDEQEGVRAPWGRGFLVATVIALAGLTAVVAAAPVQLVHAGLAIENLAGLAHDEAAGAAATCESECPCGSEMPDVDVARLAQQQQQQSALASPDVVAPAELSGAGSAGGGDDALYYEIFFTDGVDSESYVWYMTSQTEAISATVLVDATGYANGVVAAANRTTVYFTSDEGATSAIMKIDRDGQDLVELFSYAGGKPMGIDYNAHLGLIVWADSELDAINSVDLDGTNFQVQIAKGSNGAVQMTSLSEPVDVAFDEYKTNLFFSHSSGIHYLNLQTLGTPAEWVTMTGVTGLSVDAIRAELFFCGPTDVHKVATHGTDRSVTTVYSGVSSPYGVAVDDSDQLLFYTAKGEDGAGAGVYRGTTGGEAAVLVAFIYDARFIAALYEAPPTPTPTPVPTDVPLPAPTSVPLPSPTSIPIQAPTALPVPGPTTYPVPAPTDLPTPEPTASPIPAPTALPIPGPTTAPTLLPNPFPTALPSPDPTALPFPGPTALPIPGPTALPTAGPTPAPTSICEYYAMQCQASMSSNPLCNCRN